MKKKDIIHSNLRTRVFKRDNYTCRYCGARNEPLHCDHVYPESRGGKTIIDNLVTACANCNHKKHAKIGIWPLPISYFNKSGNFRPEKAIFALLFVIMFILFWVAVVWGSQPIWNSVFAFLTLLCGFGLRAMHGVSK